MDRYRPGELPGADSGQGEVSWLVVGMWRKAVIDAIRRPGVARGQLYVPTSRLALRGPIGHGTHTKAAVWKQHLEALLKQTER
jgi:hypothetical protein